MKSNQYRNLLIKYCLAIFIATVCYWLLYFVVAWGLYGVANLSRSESVMNWLVNKNHFEAAERSPLSEYYQQQSQEPNNISINVSDDIEEGVEYLNTHKVWIKDEMDSIPCLQGLFEDLNYYELAKIQERAALINSVPLLREIVNALVEYHKSGKEITETYNRPGDNCIRPYIYINQINRGLNSYNLELTPIHSGKSNMPSHKSDKPTKSDNESNHKISL